MGGAGGPSVFGDAVRVGSPGRSRAAPARSWRAVISWRAAWRPFGSRGDHLPEGRVIGSASPGADLRVRGGVGLLGVALNCLGVPQIRRIGPGGPGSRCLRPRSSLGLFPRSVLPSTVITCSAGSRPGVEPGTEDRVDLADRPRRGALRAGHGSCPRPARGRWPARRSSRAEDGRGVEHGRLRAQRSFRNDSILMDRPS